MPLVTHGSLSVQFLLILTSTSGAIRSIVDNSIEWKVLNPSFVSKGLSISVQFASCSFLIMSLIFRSSKFLVLINLGP